MKPNKIIVPLATMWLIAIIVTLTACHTNVDVLEAYKGTWKISVFKVDGADSLNNIKGFSPLYCSSYSIRTPKQNGDNNSNWKNLTVSNNGCNASGVEGSKNGDSPYCLFRGRSNFDLGWFLYYSQNKYYSLPLINIGGNTMLYGGTIDNHHYLIGFVKL